MSDEKQEPTIAEATWKAVGIVAGGTGGALVVVTVAAASPVLVPAVMVGTALGMYSGYKNPAGAILRYIGILGR